MQPSALHIERLHNVYLVPDGQAMEEVRDYCESRIAATLSTTLATALAPALAASDPSLWFIRRLEIDFAMNTESEHSSPPDVWAKEIAAGVTTALQKGGPEVVSFPDRSAYLAHFLLDLAEGCAWSKWYYSGFDGLRMLPVSAALRTALCDSRETGLKALCSLNENAAATVLKRVNAADAARILEAFASGTAETDVTPCLQAIDEAWPAAFTVSSNEEELRALLLFAGAARKNPALAGKTLAAATTALCRFVHHFSGDHELWRALRQGDAALLYRRGGLEHASVLAPLLRCSPECLEPLLQRIAGGPATDPQTRVETRFTSFGGAFLLLPLLDGFPFSAATAGWPDLENVSAENMARFLVLAKCFGRSRAAGCFHDALIRDLMRITPQITLEMARDWLGRLSRENVNIFLGEISRWHLETAAAEWRAVTLAPVAQKGAPVALMADHARGLWLFAGKTGKQAESLAGALGHLPCPEKLFCHESLAALAQRCFPDAAIELSDGFPFPSPAREIYYLELPPEFGRRPADLALSVAAQGALRLFSCRLTGFARSSLNYLYSNFLDCCAGVEERVDQRVVVLARPPLHLVLGMSGLNRCSYRLGWLDDRPCAIFPEG